MLGRPYPHCPFPVLISMLATIRRRFEQETLKLSFDDHIIYHTPHLERLLSWINRYGFFPDEHFALYPLQFSVLRSFCCRLGHFQTQSQITAVQRTSHKIFLFFSTLTRTRYDTTTYIPTYLPLGDEFSSILSHVWLDIPCLLYIYFHRYKITHTHIYLSTACPTL